VTHITFFWPVPASNKASDVSGITFPRLPLTKDPLTHMHREVQLPKTVNVSRT